MKATINQEGSVVKASGETLEYTLSTSPDCFCAHMNVLLSQTVLKCQREKGFRQPCYICHRYSTGSSSHHLGRFPTSESVRTKQKLSQECLSESYLFHHLTPFFFYITAAQVSVQCFSESKVLTLKYRSCLDRKIRAYIQTKKKTLTFRQGVHAVQSDLIFHTELSQW